MRNNIIFFISVLIFILGCMRENSKEVAIKINEFVITADEFEEKFENSAYYKDEKGREKFLEDLINRKLLLQEAERLKLDREKEFLKEIESFWEKTLLKNIIDRKSKELAGKVWVNEDEIRAHYEKMREQEKTLEDFEEMYEQIKWQILREKQTKAFDDWLKDLRKRANIEVNKELLGIK